MIQSPHDDRTPPMTPQLALRVAVIGTCALIMFAVIFFRLWFLQVLSGSTYAAQAQSNVTRKIPVAAERGDILSSNGTILVGSQEVPAIEIATPQLPVQIDSSDLDNQPAKDYAVYDKLAKVLQMSTKPKSCPYTVYTNKGAVDHDPSLAPIPCLIAQGLANTPYANVVIKSDVSPDIRDYLQEREAQFPGVVSEQVYLRQYRYGELAAQVLGYVRPITQAEVGTKNFKGAGNTDIVGQAGLEYQYNLELQGKDGYDAVKVNSDNQFEGYAKEKPEQQGENLQLSLDLSLEQTGLSALQHSIDSNPGAVSGSFVAMDPDNGQVYAMGSLPSYNPSWFTKPLSAKAYQQDFGDPNAAPLVDRAISSPLPDGSTFKVITATAALETGVIGIDDDIDDTGQFCYPGVSTSLPGSCIQNSGGAASGPIDLENAIRVSDDVYFYNLGYRLYQRDGKNANDWPLQKWAKAFGIGQTTGIDLPGESSGVLPTPAYLTGLYKQELECEHATGGYRYTAVIDGQRVYSATKQPGYSRSTKTSACGISNYNLSYWVPGDTVEMGVGQGDDLVTPIQLAVVYAAIENGGTIVTPHVAQDTLTQSGTVITKFNYPAKRKLSINPIYLNAIRTGLNEAAQTAGGTSYDVMGNFPEPVYGKTGTAELGDSANSPEDAWYACYVPSKTKPIVVVVNVEKGGFGDVAAAPVAREILSQWFLGKPGPYVTGTGTDSNTG